MGTLILVYTPFGFIEVVRERDLGGHAALPVNIMGIRTQLSLMYYDLDKDRFVYSASIVITQAEYNALVKWNQSTQGVSPFLLSS
jgi:hypothetical protein